MEPIWESWMETPLQRLDTCICKGPAPPPLDLEGYASQL